MTNQILIAMTTPKKHPFKRLADFFLALFLVLLPFLLLLFPVLPAFGWLAHLCWTCLTVGWRAF